MPLCSALPHKPFLPGRSIIPDCLRSQHHMHLFLRWCPTLKFGGRPFCRLPSHVSLPQLGVPRLLGTIYPSPLFFKGNQHQNPSSGRILKCLLILAACAFNRSWYYCSGLWVDLWSCLFPPFVYLRHRRNPPFSGRCITVYYSF